MSPAWSGFGSSKAQVLLPISFSDKQRSARVGQLDSRRMSRSAVGTLRCDPGRVAVCGAMDHSGTASTYCGKGVRIKTMSCGF
jgi:hypothetical protein